MAGISCGVVGLPNVGKSTLFNALTRAGAKVENYPFCTIDPNVGVLEVPDPRLDELNAVEQRLAAIPATIELVDIAGLVEGASRGEGRGNQFLENIRHVDLIVHVVRAFGDPNVAHTRADLDPLDDIRIISLELLLADLQTAERALERYRRQARSLDREAKHAVTVLEQIVAHLDQERSLRTIELSAADWAAIPDCQFLSRKPVMYVANVGEDDLPAMASEHVARIREHAAAERASVFPLCAKIEAELAELEAEDEAEFLAALGLDEDATSRLIRECYRQLGLISFFTVGDHEVRAWTTHLGATAPEAGRVIHNDFHDYFIRAEVIGFEDFRAYGSRPAAREHGRMRIEGKEYLVEDGDILFFRIGK
jgi:GTP-binding protein YchF